jgi:4-hydroxy-3-polyprenylbenzoate decarboxylase
MIASSDPGRGAVQNIAERKKRIIIAITGASGALMGVRALEMLSESGVETHLVVSNAACLTITRETGRRIEDITAMASCRYDPDDLGAAIASGSFVTQGMMIVPCSIKTLSAVANSYADNLIVRAADVCLKEGRPLLLAVREAPLHGGHLRLMQLAARAGAIIYPPIPFFYGAPRSLDEALTQTVGRMLLRMGIDNPNYPRWVG